MKKKQSKNIDDLVKSFEKLEKEGKTKDITKEEFEKNIKKTVKETKPRKK